MTMHRYTFSGRILPERANVTLGQITFEGLHSPGTEFEGKLTVSIHASQILMHVETEEGNLDIFTLKNSLESLVKTEVDSYGYISGRGYDVEITAVVDENGSQTVFGVGMPEIEKDSPSRPFSFEKVLSLTVKSIHLRHALGDLRETIRSPFDTAFFCYRAIEDVRQHFCSDDTDDKSRRESWEKLRTFLRVERSFISKLEHIAKNQRHGQFNSMDTKERSDYVLRVWKIVDRFCIYLERKETPLSPEEFPLLD